MSSPPSATETVIVAPSESLALDDDVISEKDLVDEKDLFTPKGDADDLYTRSLAQSEEELDRLLDDALEKGDEKLEPWQVLTHIFKAFVGTGILGLPSAVTHAGVVVGPILLFLLGSMCMYSLHLLVKTARNMREKNKVASMSYSAISEELFSIYGVKTGKAARYTTDLLLCTLQLGFCCVYVVFVSHNIASVFNDMDVRVWMVILLPLLIVQAILVDIKRLAYMTTIGNVIVLVGLGIIYQYLFCHMHSPASYPASGGFINTAVSAGQIVYAFEGVAVILPVEKKLKKREEFNWLLNCVAAAIMVLYVSMGLLGYLTFGEHTMGSITLNLPQTTFYRVLQMFFALMVFLTYPLQLYLSVEIVREYIVIDVKNKREKFTEESIIKAILITCTCACAIIIPQLDNFMALVGAFSGVFVSLILPPTLHMLYHWDQQMSTMEVVIDATIMIVGFLVCISGTLSSIFSILNRYANTGGVEKVVQ